MRPIQSWASAQPLRQLLDHLSDAVLLFDRHGVLSFANGAALRLLACEAGMPVAAFSALFGEAAVTWLRRAMAGAPPASSLPPAQLADGRSAHLVWQMLDATHSALRVLPDAATSAGAPAQPRGDTKPPVTVAGDVVNELLQVLWSSPFPVTLQDAGYRLIDVNAACVEFIGHPRERLIGLDPIELQPPEDQASTLALRKMLVDRGETPVHLVERRLIAADGRERWFKAAQRVLVDGTGTRFFLDVLQDCTAEHLARERADRSARELDDWFDLSPIGMVLYDESGLLVRTNPALEHLVGVVPALLHEAPSGLQHLLAWGDATALPHLRPGDAPLVREGWLPQADGNLRRLRATIRCYQTSGGQHRFMAAVEDRSLEEERDLAQMQIGALMDTAGVGLATFQESSGWVRQAERRHSASHAAAPPSAALQSISRDIVLPDSLPEYEKLQQALRHAQRAEVRYAIRHPELGLRWLLTRVEPATLASGKRTTSVVTLDITEQQATQARSEELLRELTTILESTTAGIAYVRGNTLVRSNRRFKVMLGLRHSDMAGRSVHELFGQNPLAHQIAADTLQALTEGLVYETEFQLPRQGGASRPAHWYALSVRRTGPGSGEAIEGIAVLSDITRLKTQQLELQVLVRDRELMFSLSEVGIAFLRKGSIQQANEALAQMAGYTVAELTNLPLSVLFPDDGHFDSFLAREEAALRSHGRWIDERTLRRRDGRLLWVQVSNRLVTRGDPAGGVIASYVNVDDRHRAEQAVALQAERTRAILDSVLVGIVTVGPSGIEWMNRSARRMFGGDLTEFINTPIGTVATPEPDHPFRQTHYLNELIEGEAETFECRVKARDGREFWVVGNVVATGRETTGRQLTYALLDIERRRQAEARIAEAQASLQLIIEAAPLAITLFNAADLTILQVNAVAARIIGRPVADCIGLDLATTRPTPLQQRIQADMRIALASPGVTQREYAFELDGESVTWDARYLPLASPGEPPDKLLLVATDVTEQQVAQQAKFDAAIAQREMLVKEVHHRIKNNLQGVAGLLQQIAQRKPEVASVISEVVGQVQAIAQVYGLQVGVTGPLVLQDVMQAITGSVQRTFGCLITLAIEGDTPGGWTLPEAEAIPIALTLNELLTNAVKRTQLGGTVACRLLSTDTEVQILIANAARLPEGFNLASHRGGVSGLGLVRALLPRRSAQFTLEQQGDEVVATVTLVPPGVVRLAGG